MPIRVTCTKCHTRFNVSDKFAGKEGPCPKCKSKIRVPEISEEVVIAAPKPTGPVDSKGRSVLKPIGRKETKISAVQITLIGVSIIGFLAVSLVLRMMVSKSDFPLWLMGLAAVLMAPPLVFVAYTFLREQDLDPYRGKELWGRVLICSAVYAITWIALPLAAFAFNDSYEVGSYVIAGIAMLGIGGLAGMFCFDFDYLMGSVHYGLYLGAGLLGRWLSGVDVLPVNEPKEIFGSPALSELNIEWWLECLANGLGLLFF